MLLQRAAEGHQTSWPALAGSRSERSNGTEWPEAPLRLTGATKIESTDPKP